MPKAVFTLLTRLIWMKMALRGKVWIGVFCVTFGVAQNSFGQYSNEWINFTQSYYKIPVAKNGIYKISYADLQAAGVPIGSIDPRRINLFFRGTEQAIFVQGQDDAKLDPSDYIEFYGQRNSGTLDADLYKPTSLQPHPYYNLFTDTTAYFLTWNPLPVQGKRMNLFSETNTSGLQKETFHNEERLTVYTNEYSGGLTLIGEIQSTAFDKGEGWTGPSICKGTSGCTGFQDFVIDNLGGGMTAGGLPQLELLLVGRDDLSHQAEISAGPAGGSVRFLSSSSFGGFETSKVNVPLNWSDIGSDGKMTVRVRITAPGLRDVLSVSYIKVSFPQDYNANLLTEKVFTLPINSSNKSYIEVTNSPPNLRVWDITDVNSISTVGTTVVSNGIGAVVSGTSKARKLYTSTATLTTSLRKVSFRSIPTTLPNFIIVSHRSLMKPALGYGDAVQAYAAYRATAAGGSYDTLTVPMDQLYNQFNYGETSPRAIYQFMKYLVNNGRPKFLFLMGKGIEVSQGFYRKTSLAATDLRDLVPSAGMPGADMAFTAGLKGTTYEPAVPTGRLTASTAVQVAAYLNKVKETEALPYKDLWRKNLLHLSGGIYAGEPEVFRSYVDGFKAVAESFFLGGSTETISKQTLNVELVNVKDQVNKGLDLITFYGHSGPGTIDIDIGYVSDPTLGYSNAGKYPGFLINGCNAGRFFDNRVTFGEDWILTPNKGAKNFIAHSFFGFTNTLKLYSDIFYSVAFGDSTFMSKGVGEVQKETARRYLQSIGSADLSTTTQVQQMMLLGDPSIPVFGARKPDYETNNGTLSIVSLDGRPVTAQSASFGVNVGIRNFGRALPSKMKVRLVRTLSDNSVITKDTLLSPVLYSATIQFVIKRGRNSNEFGNNNFTVIIDPSKEISELDKSNNTASLDFFIPLSGTRNIYPEPYAIVNTGPVELLFQNTDLLSDTRTFKVEVDTASTFDSPYLKRQTAQGKVLARLKINLLTDDSLVYYWRTKFDKPLSGESTQWSASTFVYIKNSPEGWAQVKFPQFSKDEMNGLAQDPNTQRIKFLETISTVDVKTYGSANAALYSQVSLKINQEEYNVATQEQPCRNNSLNLVAFDKGSTAPYAGIPFPLFFDPRACGRAPQMINNFLLSELITGNKDDLDQWVKNVKANDSVVVFSIGDAGYASWSTTVKQQLAQLGIGITQLNGVTPGEPFVIFGKKGSVPGSAKVIRSNQTPANAQQVSVNKTITGRYTQGSIVSVTVGPAQQWSQLIAKITEATVNDQYGVDVTGIDLAGHETLLKSKLKNTQTLSDINAQKYPYLRLTLQAKDEIDLTVVQLRKWLVTYVPLPEGMLTYNGKQQPETVQEGQEWKSNYGFTNISSRKFSDSLLVQIDVFSNQKKSSERKTFRIKPPAPKDTSKFSITVKTKGKAGDNDVTVFVNPRVLPEPYYDNNVLALYSHLQVQADRTAPVLDVTLDGRHVTNGDAVSSAPMIRAKVIDRNPFYLKADTTGVNLYLSYPCAQEECPYKRINFSRKDVTWTPATATTDFQVTFHPEGLTAGQYTLKVEAIDGSGNSSGPDPYEVTFLRDDESKFVVQSVYPNPSSDKFHFKIFLGGPLVPEDFQLNIYAPAGGRIRSFGNESLGALHVGTNEIIMDATDPNGNPLSSGIYLFRMIASINGAQFVQSGRLMVVRSD